MWEYRCPECGTYVEKPYPWTCPKCKYPFGGYFENEWRVPPRFLKNSKAMSDYAHKVLAPKLSPEQRELLFKYFTILFRDGFDDGTFDAWSAVVGTPTVVTTQKHHGTHSMYVTGSGADYARVNFANQAHAFARIYVRINSKMPNYTTWDILDLKNFNTMICKLRIYHTTGTNYYLRIWRYFPSSAQAFSVLVATDTGEWHSFMMEILVHASVGKYVAYFDDDEVGSETGLDTSGATQINRIHAGNSDVGTVDYHIDCVVVADTYIGPLPTEIFVANDFPRTYLEKPVKAKELANKIEGVTVIHVAKDFPEKLMKKGAAAQLQSYWEY
ncbi:hypothetical protein ES703_69906 [subsurface metagenome]